MSRPEICARWCAAEIDIMRAARSDESSDIIGQRLAAAGYRRSRKAINQKRSELNLPRPIAGRFAAAAFTAAEDAILAAHPLAPSPKLAALLATAGYARTPEACYSRRRTILMMGETTRRDRNDALAPHTRDARGYPWFQLTGWPANNSQAGLARRYS